jgi:hypothetical protein
MQQLVVQQTGDSRTVNSSKGSTPTAQLGLEKLPTLDNLTNKTQPLDDCDPEEHSKG